MISIIIVNWNAGQQLIDLVFSIKSHHTCLVESVIIVDNASTDSSLELLAAASSQLPFPLYLIRNKENRGFSAACNQGAAMARSEYLLFLNPDTRLLENSLSVPYEFMQKPGNAKVGICGIQLVDQTGHVTCSCARFPSLGRFAAEALGMTKLPCFRSWNHHMTEWDHGATREVDHVIGAFYLVRRSLFESLGGFDERFFVYLEDLDLSFRVSLANYRSMFLADAHAFHAGGGTSHQVMATRLFYSLRSRLLYGFKHFSRNRAILLLVVTMLIEPISRVVFSSLRGGAGDARNTLTAYGMLWQDLPAILNRGLRHT